MLATVNIDYRYAFPSALTADTTSQRRLQLATSGGIATNPYFFTGRMTNPKETADLLLAVSAVSRTRFFSPGELRERMLAAADPVVTSDGSRLRFEVFSVCCGCYARLDLEHEAVDGNWMGKGTTNVDFNPPMRGALASIVNSDAVGLKIGADRVEIENAGQCIVERKVKLPVRWLKGFVEVQVYQSTLKPKMELPALALANILRTLPQQNIMQAGVVTYLVPSGKSLRLSQRQTPQAIPIGAISRLKMLEPLLRYAKSVRIYSSDDAVSAFELTLAQGRFYFVLSPNAARGFSGEGQALQGLADSGNLDVLSRVKAALVWQEKIDAEALAHSLSLDTKIVSTALQTLGARGLVGYDLSNSSYFHRELPFDLTLIEELHPRMKKARALVTEKKVRLKSADDGTTEAFVAGKSAEHFVQFTENGSRCTCDWFAKNQGDRGPCSHILAAELAMQEATCK